MVCGKARIVGIRQIDVRFYVAHLIGVVISVEEVVAPILRPLHEFKVAHFIIFILSILSK